MIQKTVYVDSARVAYIEQETKMKYQEWVRQITEREYQAGTQQIMNLEIPDLRCSCGFEWEYDKAKTHICEKCGGVGSAIK